jgi:hypothetical protein
LAAWDAGADLPLRSITYPAALDELIQRGETDISLFKWLERQQAFD